MRKRGLSPSIEEQCSYHRQRLNDTSEYLVEINSGKNRLVLDGFSH